LPIAPLLKLTVLFVGVEESNPVPWMINVGAVMARLVVFVMTVGAETMFAT